MSVLPTTTSPAVDEGLTAVAGAAGEGVVRLELPSLKSRAILASVWTTGAYIAQQGFRLISNLVLTRLLAPDVMGMMLLISVFLQGLQMFSDIGIGPSIIQNPRGNKQEFLNTAFTIQAFRGGALWLVACAGAWPMADYYNEPRYLYLIPISAFASVISGFNSTSLVTLNRSLRLKKITILGVADQLVQFGVTVIWALFDPSVWALIAGSTASHLFYTITSHFILPGHKNRFQWNKADAREMIHFGRWIFLSTALTFVAGSADKFVLAKILGPAVLALYGNAYQFAVMPAMFLKKIGGIVAFPALAEVARERRDEMYRVLRKVRMILLGLSLVALLPLVLLGEPIIKILYVGEYENAGWMLELLAAGMLAGIVNGTYGAPLLALGRSFEGMVLLIIQMLILFAGFWFANRVGTTRALVMAVAAVEWLNYPFTAAVMARFGLWQPEIDLPVLAFSAGVVALTMYVI